MRPTFLIFWVILPAMLYGQLNDVRHFLPLGKSSSKYGHAQISAKRLYLTDIYHLAASFSHGTEYWRVGHFSQGWVRPGYIESNINTWVTRRILKAFAIGVGGSFYSINADESHDIRINSEIILKCSPSPKIVVRFAAQNLLSLGDQQSILTMPRISWHTLFRVSQDFQVNLAIGTHTASRLNFLVQTFFAVNNKWQLSCSVRGVPLQIGFGVSRRFGQHLSAELVNEYDIRLGVSPTLTIRSDRSIFQRLSMFPGDQ